MMQTSREVVTARQTAPEDGQTRVTEICRGFNDVVYKHFFFFCVLNANVFLKECMSWIT
jgi:hypothetical protein